MLGCGTQSKALSQPGGGKNSRSERYLRGRISTAAYHRPLPGMTRHSAALAARSSTLGRRFGHGFDQRPDVAGYLDRPE